MPVADTAEDSIRVFLSANADELRLGVSDENLKVIQDVSTPVRRIVRFQQVQDGIPVFGGIVTVQLDKNNQVETTRPGPRASSPGRPTDGRYEDDTR